MHIRAHENIAADASFREALRQAVAEVVGASVQAPPLLNTKAEACKRLRISPSKFDQLVAEDRIPVVRQGEDGRKVFIREDDLVAYVRNLVAS